MRHGTQFVLAGCLLAATVPASPQAPERYSVSTVLLRAMNDEMKRTVEHLRLDQLAPPYFVAQTVDDQRTLVIEGSFGAIRRSRRFDARTLRLELRVGSREFDDAHFVSTDVRSYAPLSSRLPVEDDYDALRFEIWSLTDGAYKQALERLSRKEAYRQSRNITDLVPDLSEEEVHGSRRTIDVAEFDRRAWERRVRELSALFRDRPRIQSSYVRLELRARHLYFVDSEGRSVVKPGHSFGIRIGAAAQADDGREQKDELLLLRHSLEGMPGKKELESLVRELAESVSALARAPRAETYLGPVLLEGQAAGEFFSQLLASGVSNARAAWVEAEWAEPYFKPGILVGRVGLRVISPFFDVHDDPTVAEFEGQELTGHFDVDDQGIPSRRAELIRAGILEDVLMSRSSTRTRAGSNGHGRGSFREPINGRIGNLFLIPRETVPRGELVRRLREEAESFGLDHGLVIRRLRSQTQTAALEPQGTGRSRCLPRITVG